MAKDDDGFLYDAILEAEKNVDNDGTPFSAVLVIHSETNDGRPLIYVSSKQPANSLACVETEVIQQATKENPNITFTEAILYSSCEPCTSCLTTIHSVGIQKVYYAANRNDAIKAGLRSSDQYDDTNIVLPNGFIEENRLSSASVPFQKWSTEEQDVKPPEQTFTGYGFVY